MPWIRPSSRQRPPSMINDDFNQLFELPHNSVSFNVIVIFTLVLKAPEIGKGSKHRLLVDGELQTITEPTLLAVCHTREPQHCSPFWGSHHSLPQSLSLLSPCLLQPIFIQDVFLCSFAPCEDYIFHSVGNGKKPFAGSCFSTSGDEDTRIAKNRLHIPYTKYGLPLLVQLACATCSSTLHIVLIHHLTHPSSTHIHIQILATHPFSTFRTTARRRRGRRNSHRQITAIDAEHVSRNTMS